MTVASADGTGRPWLQDEPGICARTQHIGERFKFPLGHRVFPGQRLGIMIIEPLIPL